MRYKLNCDYCKREYIYLVQPSVFNRNKNHFCSKECQDKFRGIIMKKDNPMKNKEIAKKQSETLKKSYKTNKIKKIRLGKGIGYGNIRYKTINYRKIPMHHYVLLKHNQLHRLPDDCVIHHLNGNKSDNSISNLQLMTKDYHNKLHWRLQK